MTITHERVKELFDYHPDGYLVWKKCRQGARKNLIAGYVHKPSGYIYCGVDGKEYRLHRLIWLWNYGNLPLTGLDHKDRNRANNKICNLRLASDSQNIANTNISVRNKSGYKGVCWNVWSKKWHASIRVNYKLKHLGYFLDVKDAAKAYDEAAKKHFGEFAKTNF